LAGIIEESILLIWTIGNGLKENEGLGLRYSRIPQLINTSFRGFAGIVRKSVYVTKIDVQTVTHQEFTNRN